MEAGFFLKGLLIGFSIAAPVGPIGVLCIQRTLTCGRLSGFLTGLGAATADALYGAIAAYGLTTVSVFLMKEQFWFRALGGAFLFYLGLKTLLSTPAEKGTTATDSGSPSAFFSSLLLTLTNPLTILSFISVFAGLGLAASGGDYLAAASMVAGVFIGSACWWLLLSGGIDLFRSRITPASFGFVHAVSGLIILGFAFWALMPLL